MAAGEWRVSPRETGSRLDRWLAAAERLGSRRRAVTALSRGQVFVDGVEQEVRAAGRRLVAGEVVRLWLDRPGSSRRKPARLAGELAVIYEDDLLLVANKAPGRLTVPAPAVSDGSLRDLVARHWRSHGRRPLVVHRIDRDTSGLVVFAKDPAAWRTLKGQFVRRTPRREYLALVEGTPSPASGEWRDWLRWNRAALRQEPAAPGAARAREAVTRYRVAEAFEACSLLEVQLVSGRQHQIRAQAWLHGHPLLGERIYCGPSPTAFTAGFPRQALHAWRLGLDHPRTGRAMTFEAPLPTDFERLLEQARRGVRVTSDRG